MEPIKYIEIALAGVIVFAIVLYLIWQIKKKGLKNFIVDFIVVAEKNIENNEDKFDYVVEKTISLIPAPLNFFITTEMVETLVQSVFDFVKVALDYRESED